MARARRARGPSLVPALAILAALGGGAWWFLGQPQPWSSPKVAPSATPPVASAPRAVAIERIDVANEGRRVTLGGVPRVLEPARDPQLGVSADALVLLRNVEMLQWREQCAGKSCAYALEWSPQSVDSRAFKTPQGHQNPSRLPFSSERFVAGEVRLGAFRIDPTLAAGATAPIAHPVRGAQLPPNLAATFRERDGVLYAGNDAGHAAAGDLRVSYRIIAPTLLRLGGVQVGDQLKAASTR